MELNNDIFEYQFEMLFQRVKNVIGESTINVYQTKEDETIASELDQIVGESNLLFDISGNDFKRYKSLDTEYRYWVEVYVLKMIKKLLERKEIWFEERIYSGCNEEYSIVLELNGKKVESYFLFDIYYEEANRTDYDKIAEIVKFRTHDVEHISIFVFRDQFGICTLPWLINNDEDKNANGFVDVSPLRSFFDMCFDSTDYSDFIKYAKAFHERCNRIISYKTIITPTKKTLSAFKQKKCNMLRDMDYWSISRKGQSGELSEIEFEKVRNSFISKKMYTAMLSNNDFADSFISAEWSYDVYSNSMGELELSGIIAGYLKSIEQLMYAIVRFHVNEGIRIKTKNGFQEYTLDNEQLIDSTLWSLNDFVTSKKGKLAISVNVRGCIKESVDLWRKYQRNGYFHKDNLYKKDNKIGEVREQTIYLYFLLLGGIEFSQQQRLDLGVMSSTIINRTILDADGLYSLFEKWLNNVFTFDLPEKIPGIWLLLIYEDKKWNLQPYLMKYFYIDEFESGGAFEFTTERVEINHLKDIPPFVWQSDNSKKLDASIQVLGLFGKYKENNTTKMQKIQAIIIGMDKDLQLIHFAE